MTTSRVDDDPILMNSHGIEAMKAGQSTPYQVFGGINCSRNLFIGFPYQVFGCYIPQSHLTAEL